MTPSATAITKEVVDSVELTLSAAQARSLVEYLDLMGTAESRFRLDNPFLYLVQSAIEAALRS